jgi:hypothetical protein
VLLSRAPAGWDSTGRIGQDGTIELTQRARLPLPVVPVSTEGAVHLGEVYWQAVRAVTLGLVRIRERDSGLELRVLGVTLLAFGPAETRVDQDEVACTFAIRGGLLAREPGGALTLAQETARPAIRSTIAGYTPRLAPRAGDRSWTGALYTQGQQRVHAATSRRYFRRLIAEARA